MKIVERLYETCVAAAYYFECDLGYLLSHFRMNISQDVYGVLHYYSEKCSQSDVILSQLKSMHIYVFKDIDHADDGMVVIEPRKGQFKTNIHKDEIGKQEDKIFICSNCPSAWSLTGSTRGSGDYEEVCCSQKGRFTLFGEDIYTFHCNLKPK
jgi:hypothetical protein